MKSKVSIAIVVIVVAVAGYLAWKFQFSPEARAIKLVKQSLVDPDSAKFDQVHFMKRTGAVCGGVNSKNRMGGYVGMSAFVVDKSGKVVIEPMVDTENGSTESRIEALQERIAFLQKAKDECAVDPGEA